jgi:hypothetical protein
MKKGKKIFQHNFWRKKTDEHIGHTAQSVLGLSKSKASVAASSCGAGSNPTPGASIK